MRIIKEKITWYDLAPPTDEELDYLKKSFKLHPVIIDELRTPSTRQKVERYEAFLYLVLRFPIYDHVKKTSTPVEIDFLIKPNEIATIRYESCEPIEEFFKNANELEGFRQKYLGKTGAEFIHGLLIWLFTYGMRELAHIDKKIAEISDAVFHGEEQAMIKEISVTKRDILDFRRITKPVAGVLHAFRHETVALYGDDKKLFFGNLLDEYNNLTDLVDNLKDTIESLEATNATLLSSKINEIMRLVSLLAFMLAPVTIIGTLFQMNTRFTPIIGDTNDWWIIMSFIGLGCAGLYIYFKKKKWL
ncbi:MAG: Mg2 transporter protein CorA family protein [Parcubacteria group bacterium GW2011_GWB1_46_8]|nr:MAG: Mg2 transporter protein CorA family protein [Parcubacteria group bacterium GW2011_GWF1_45_5]KKU43231.1 MAG: Mg2 transporter protein CorA family protein [Parcubacteria group bacterium GW2011_GWA2_46_7]KKU45937.1 MAG: Mg2 transporter protein CorA family protein [Parcubacteria group bacterium GW2011_GWB1_46_8]KKU46898.1 MAG: Mg2 transporter protein CorA family protein [Parcubacteria group bacterium GW2011_GWF2_46_8]